MNVFVRYFEYGTLSSAFSLSSLIKQFRPKLSYVRTTHLHALVYLLFTLDNEKNVNVCYFCNQIGTASKFLFCLNNLKIIDKH